MLKRQAAVVLGSCLVAAVGSVSAQQKAGAKSVTYDLTVKTDGIYTGTMDIAVDRGKVSGRLHVTAPTEITGKVQGTAKAGLLALDFPYEMTERKCTGTVKMTIQLPENLGAASGAMEAVGCGRDATNKLTGTVEIIPSSLKKAGKG